MERNHILLTSEAVTEGHPDKIADQISDSVLDAIIAQDPMARVACETLVTTGMVHVVGEIITNCYIDIPKIVREVVKSNGYTCAKSGFGDDTCGVLISTAEQSPNIVCKAMKARNGEMDVVEASAGGNQEMMFGYATNETPECMPLPISMAHKLAHRLSEVCKAGDLAYLRPVGKTQVTVEYIDGKPARIDTIVISTQHSPEVDQTTIKNDIIAKVITPIVPQAMIDSQTKYYINPAGRFVVGRPRGDAGLTGRKIIVNTCGGMARHGGGTFFGKDPTKVDRSAAYAARYVAKNVVAAGLADKCEIQLAYASGIARPVSIMVETFGTAKVAETDIVALINQHFDLTGLMQIMEYNYSPNKLKKKFNTVQLVADNT